MKQITKIRLLIVFFIIALILSGVTAFPAETELHWLLNHPSLIPNFAQHWLQNVYNALVEANTKYPMLAYGYDWLAFAHIVIAMAFIGPLKDPVRNKWIIDWAILVCIAVIPLAFYCRANQTYSTVSYFNRLQFWCILFNSIIHMQELDKTIGEK